MKCVMKLLTRQEQKCLKNLELFTQKELYLMNPGI